MGIVPGLSISTREKGRRKESGMLFPGFFTRCYLRPCSFFTIVPVQQVIQELGVLLQELRDRA
jgi:hypothetical protein